MPRAHDIPTIFLKPGEAHCGPGPSRVVTVLGSCVSIVLFHRGERFGAMCHAIMPSRGGRGLAAARGDLSYVDGSVAWMLAEFVKRGLPVEEIDAKVFGGAALLGEPRVEIPYLAVGRRNFEAAFHAIQTRKINLTAWNVGGKRGRKIIFYPDTGEVYAGFVSTDK